MWSLVLVTAGKFLNSNFPFFLLFNQISLQIEKRTGATSSFAGFCGYSLYFSFIHSIRRFLFCKISAPQKMDRRKVPVENFHDVKIRQNWSAVLLSTLCM